MKCGQKDPDKEEMTRLRINEEEKRRSKYIADSTQSTISYDPIKAGSSNLNADIILLQKYSST